MHVIFPLELWHVTKHIKNSTRLFLEEKARMTCFAIPHSKKCTGMVYGFRDLIFDCCKGAIFSPPDQRKAFLRPICSTGK